jgi:hypothetical protein
MAQNLRVLHSVVPVSRNLSSSYDRHARIIDGRMLEITKMLPLEAQVCTAYK